MQAILLAAGFGTRLRPYTLIRPKPLFPVLNRPLLHWLLDILQDAGCSKIIVNCHHLAEQIGESLDAYPGVLIQVEPQILGTGGSLRLAAESLAPEPILVMNGDIFHTVDVSALYEEHCSSGNSVTLAMHDYSRFNNVGVQGDRVVSFRPEKGMRKLAFTGIHVVEPEVLKRIPQHGFFHIIDLYRELAMEAKVGLSRVDGALWRDIGTPEDYLHLHRELLEGGIPVARPIKGQRSGAWLLAEDTSIGEDVRFMDWGCLGRGAFVEKGARLGRSIIWDGAHVPPGSRIFDSIITGA